MSSNLRCESSADSCRLFQFRDALGQRFHFQIERSERRRMASRTKFRGRRALVEFAQQGRLDLFKSGVDPGFHCRQVIFQFAVHGSSLILSWLGSVTPPSGARNPLMFQVQFRTGEWRFHQGIVRDFYAVLRACQGSCSGLRLMVIVLLRFL
jgi:hypothetical protein